MLSARRFLLMRGVCGRCIGTLGGAGLLRAGSLLVKCRTCLGIEIGSSGAAGRLLEGFKCDGLWMVIQSPRFGLWLGVGDLSDHLGLPVLPSRISFFSSSLDAHSGMPVG